MTGNRHGGMVIVGKQLRHCAQSVGNGSEHVTIKREIGLLRHVGDTQARLPSQRTVIKHRLTGEHLEQAGLAAAITPDQGHPLAGNEAEISTRQQVDMPEREMRTLHADQ